MVPTDNCIHSSQLEPTTLCFHTCIYNSSS